MNKIIKVVLTILLLLTLSGCSFFNNNIYLIYTNDVHGNMDEPLNYASLKAYVTDFKKENGEYILLDGGDFAKGEIANDLEKSKEIIRLMNDVGYDIVTLGNHEFDYGIKEFEEIIRKSKFDIVSCNLEFKDNDYLNKKILDYKTENIRFKKIAFIGIMTPDVLKEDSISGEQLTVNNEYLIDVYADINNLDDDGGLLIEKIQGTVDSIRNNVDYVVVLSHLGSNNNHVLTSYELIQHTYGIDIVLDAHSHSILNEIRKNKNDEDVVLFSTGFNMNNIGIVTINNNGKIETSLINEYSKNSTLEKRIEEIFYE